MSFGSRLDEAITMRGITQRKFAKMVGTSEVSISRYINGERNPKMPTAIKMADILNVSLDWLAIDESERKVGKKAKAWMNDAPSADRPQGKWIRDRYWSRGIGMGEEYGFFYKCSLCEYEVENGYTRCGFNFCPYCGADMREREGE